MRNLGSRSQVFSLDQMSLCLLSSQGFCTGGESKPEVTGRGGDVAGSRGEPRLSQAPPPSLTIWSAEGTETDAHPLVTAPEANNDTAPRQTLQDLDDPGLLLRSPEKVPA